MLATENLSFQSALAASERIHWRVEDLIGGDKRLDFSRPFLPEAMARTALLDFLSPAEKLAVNQIRGHSYLHMFLMFEDFILPFVMDHTRAEVDPTDNYRMRAMLQFAAEEAKHMHLFRRFATAFREGFGTDCAAIGPVAEMTKQMLTHSPFALALLVLQGEWMSQRHYTDSVHDDGGIDPCFKSMLKHHWMEEAQHAKLDLLMVQDMARSASQAEIMRAFDEYVELGNGLDGGLKMQTQLDMEAFMAHTGRVLTEEEKHRYLGIQHQAMRWTFIGSGMTHPVFAGTLERLNPAAAAKLGRIAPMFC